MNGIENYKKKLKSDGYVLVKNFFKEEIEFRNLKNFLQQFIKFTLKNKNIKNVDKVLSTRFKKDSQISAYFNDNINLSPYLSSLFISKKLILFLSKILKVKKKNIILNNQRFRIQIPGNDNVANLPWHQDIVYNKIKSSRSVVVWISIGNITKNMGPIIFKKNSHKFGVQKIIKFKKNNGNYVPSVDINNKNLKKLDNVQYYTFSGDLILIDMKTVHASGENRTKDKVKYSAQARYHVINKF